MLVLLFHHMSLDKRSSLHLESEDFWKLADPCSLRGFVPLTVLIVLIIWNFTSEYVLPCLVEIVFILDIQNDIMLSLLSCSPLWNLFLIAKLD